MSEDKVILHLVGKKDDMAELFGIPAQFTESQSGAPSYLKSVYIKATEKKVIARGASDSSAIEMSMDSFDVQVPGQGLFLALNVNTIISTFSTGDNIELIGYEGGEYTISQTDGPRSASDKAVAIDNSTHLPEVGEYHKDNFVSIDPEEFTNSFGIVSNAVSENVRPIFSGIYYERSGDRLVMCGSNGGSLLSTMTVPLSTEKQTPGDADIAGLLHSGNTSSRAALMRSGDVMTIHSSEDSSAHFLIYSKGEVIYHMRISQLDSGTKGNRKYPIRQILGASLNMLKGSSRHSVTLDRHELIALLGNGVTIGSLDQMSEMGRNRQVNLYLERSDETDPSSVLSIIGRVYSGEMHKNDTGDIAYSGDLRFEDSFEAQEQKGFESEKVAFGFRYGLYGSVIRSIPVDGSITLNLIVDDTSGIPKAAIVYDMEPEKKLDLSDVTGEKGKPTSFPLEKAPRFLTVLSLNGLYTEGYED